MKKIRLIFPVIIFAASLLNSGVLLASGGHSHAHDDAQGHSGGMGHHEDDHEDDHEHQGMAEHDTHKETSSMFLLTKDIDGYQVTFHIMPAKLGQEMGGSHNFMVKVEKDGKVLGDIIMNTKVKHPNGQSETKKTMRMGDWLMAGYDLGHPGKHQAMILFKTADGKKHKGGIYYP